MGWGLQDGIRPSKKEKRNTYGRFSCFTEGCLHCVMSQQEGPWQMSAPCYWTPQPLVMRKQSLSFINYQDVASSCSDRQETKATSFAPPHITESRSQKNSAHQSWGGFKRGVSRPGETWEYFCWLLPVLISVTVPCSGLLTISSFAFRLSSVLCST